MPRGDQSRIPAPSHTVMVEPAAVMIWSPAPRIVTDPRPAVPILPGPSTSLVRRPVCRQSGRPPHISVFRNARPGSSRIEILGAIDARADITRTHRLHEHTIAAV